jgi:hypothetical protein
MSQEIKLLDEVALTEDLPHRGLMRGHVGTVVEQLASNVFEVEFDDCGRTYATLALQASQLMVLHHEEPVGLARRWHVPGDRRLVSRPRLASRL